MRLQGISGPMQAVTCIWSPDLNSSFHGELQASSLCLHLPWLAFQATGMQFHLLTAVFSQP